LVLFPHAGPRSPRSACRHHAHPRRLVDLDRSDAAARTAGRRRAGRHHHADPPDPREEREFRTRPHRGAAGGDGEHHAHPHRVAGREIGITTEAQRHREFQRTSEPPSAASAPRIPESNRPFLGVLGGCFVFSLRLCALVLNGTRNMADHYTGLINRYRDRLPVRADTPVITLNEGNTPLIELAHLPKKLKRDVRVLCKFEGLNPTGSFKDRGMTMAVTKAAEAGAKAIICASTGNTSASAAAYAARAGMTCFVLIPQGQIALGKLSQAMMHGSVVIQIRGNFDDGMRLVQEV